MRVLMRLGRKLSDRLVLKLCCVGIRVGPYPENNGVSDAALKRTNLGGHLHLLLDICNMIIAMEQTFLHFYVGRSTPLPVA